MAYVVMIHATFDTKADADHIYDQAMSVATNASVARLGEAGERTSHGGVFDEQPDGSLVADRRFHIDRFNIVREGKATVAKDETPVWVAPSGTQDAYPLTDVWGSPARVLHNESLWENTVDGNTYEPGVYGWNQV